MEYSTALEIHDKDAKTALIKEFTQLIRLRVLKFHKAKNIPKAILKKRIPSKTFIKVKYKPNNDFDKIKARFVGGGHRQDRSLYTENETSSPTISLVGLFIVAVIAAKEKRHVYTVDIGGAYLRAKIKKLISQKC